jgi:hypothetical protein
MGTTGGGWTARVPDVQVTGDRLIDRMGRVRFLRLSAALAGVGVATAVPGGSAARR